MKIMLLLTLVLNIQILQIASSDSTPSDYEQIVDKMTNNLKENNKDQKDSNRIKRQLVGVHVFKRPKQKATPRDGGGHGHQIHDPYSQKGGGGYDHQIHDPYSQKGGGGHGHQIHDPYSQKGGGGHVYQIHDSYSQKGDGGYDHNDHHGGGYGHDDPIGGYGHNIHDVHQGGGYGHDLGGYKEPPKKVKPAPYYGPQYSPYDLVAPDKSKKGKIKYGDDPVLESLKGAYHADKYDKPFKHFGGFGGGGSVGYNAGSLKGNGGGGYGGSQSSYGGDHGGGYGGGHKGGGGGGGYGGDHGGGGGGYGGDHGGGGGGYGGSHGGGVGGGGYGTGGGGGGYGDHSSGSYGGGYNDHGKGYEDQDTYKGQSNDNRNKWFKGLKGLKLFKGNNDKDPKDPIPHVDYLPMPLYSHLAAPYNTYDAQADLRTDITKGTAVDVSHMLLADPYTSSRDSKKPIKIAKT